MIFVVFVQVELHSSPHLGLKQWSTETTMKGNLPLILSTAAETLKYVFSLMMFHLNHQQHQLSSWLMPAEGLKNHDWNMSNELLKINGLYGDVCSLFSRI